MWQAWLLLCCRPRQQLLIKLHNTSRRCQLAQRQLIKSTNQATVIAAQPPKHCEYLIRSECYFFLDFFPYLSRCFWFGNHKLFWQMKDWVISIMHEREGRGWPPLKDIWVLPLKILEVKFWLVATKWFITVPVWSARLQNERGKVGESFHCILCATVIWG